MILPLYTDGTVANHVTRRTLKNPNVSEEAKQSAKERLEGMEE